MSLIRTAIREQTDDQDIDFNQNDESIKVGFFSISK
jgi:hypothetical protein